MKDRAIWLLALGTIVVSVGTSAVVVSALTPGPRKLASTGPGPADDTGAVVRELSALRSFLEKSETRRLEPAAPVRGARQPSNATPGIAAGDLDRLIQAIDRLEVTTREEAQATRVALADAAESGLATRTRREEIDWTAWEDVWGDYQADEKAGADKVRLMTTNQLLARFGPPTDVRSKENGLRTWYYYDPEGTQPLSVTVQIVDDYVTWVWMEI